MEAITLTAPSYWASYLINGDSSGMEDQEIAACDAWIAGLDCGAPVDCEDAGFIKYHDAHHVMPLAADCQRYTFFLRDRS